MCLEQRAGEGNTGESQQLVLQEPSLAFHFILRAEGSHRGFRQRRVRSVTGRGCSGCFLEKPVGMGGEQGDRETPHEAAVSPR